MKRLMSILAIVLSVACGDSRPAPASAAVPAPPVATAGAPEGFIDVPGGRVFYRVMGGGDRTPLILLHGGPGGRSCAFECSANLPRIER